MKGVATASHKRQRKGLSAGTQAPPSAKGRILPLDRVLLLLILALLLYGSVMIFSASTAYAQTRFGDPYYFVRRQLLWAGGGILVMLSAARLSPEKLQRVALPFFGAVTVLLSLVPLIGSEAGGAKRWISIGAFSFQPSELAKTALVLFLASYFTKYAQRIRSPQKRWEGLVFGILLPFLAVGLLCGLVVLEKHLSCTIILFVIGLFMMLMGGSSIKVLGGLCLGGGGAVATFAMAVEYTRRRILIWQNPELYPTDGGWQTLQGLMAIGSGGFFGLGLGQSRLKYMYVSEPQNDFIFTILCEETGFLGALLMLLMFAAFTWRGCVIAIRHPSLFCRMVAVGIVGKVTLQVLLNLGVVTNLLPNTGISLPFFSYGGSSLLVLLLEMGILLAISRGADCKH